jgi:hypothetical protein
MAELWFTDVDETSSERVTSDHPLPVRAVSPAPVQAYQTVGYEQVTVANATVGLTATKYSALSPLARAVCRLETAEIRYTVDGQTVPTTTVGTLLEISDVLTITGQLDLEKFRAIRTGGTSGVLNVSYEDVVL